MASFNWKIWKFQLIWKKIQKYLALKNLIQLKEYLIQNTNWLCQCNYQNLKGFRCLIHKFLEAFLRQFELNLQENQLTEALIKLLKSNPEEFKEVDHYCSC